jgi:thiamine biosynthesis lipoprotein
MNRYRVMRPITLILPVCLLFSAGCSRTKTVQKTDSIMGTEVTVTVAAKSEAEGGAAIDAAMAEVRRLDRMMSLYRDDSEITKVNLAAGRHPVRVSPEMIEVVEAANRVSDLTGGAFDVTVGPLVVLWQMRLKEGRAPTGREIANIKQLVNYRNIMIDKKASTLFLKTPGMILDFGGVAKGYAADNVVKLLKKRGIGNAIAAIAGDIRVIGRRPAGSPWRIGVQDPREKDKMLTVLDLSDKYISTSGDYERYKVVQKKRYHHIIDPRSGKPSEGMRAVTLISDRGAIGDPLTTALFVLGTEQGMKIVKTLGYEAIFDDSRGRVTMTDGIKTKEDRPGR